MLGGRGFGYSVWLNDIFIGSNTGSASNHGGQSTFTFSQLAAGTENVVTIIYVSISSNIGKCELLTTRLIATNGIQ